MKTSILKTVVYSIFLFTGMISCEKNPTEIPDQSTGVKKFLEMKTRINAMNANSGQMSNFLSVIGNNQFKNRDLNLEGIDIDSAYIDSIYSDTLDYWNYYTCATVTEFNNNDGTQTTIYDYGDGCDEYGSLIKGKITYTWGNEGNNYYSKVIYDRYYSYGVEMNGISEYSFISDGNSFYSTGIKENADDSTHSITVEFNWSGSSTGNEDISMIYDSGEIYSYLSNYSNKWDSSSFTILNGEYQYISASDEFEYHYLVTKPLVTNYTCTNTWVPVSGIESATYKESGVTSSFSINYGNGTCDNLAQVTENGETSVIDFGELFQIYSDDTVSGGSSPGNAGKGR